MHQQHFKKINQTLRFKDAWVSADKVILYSGVAGWIGESEEFPRNKQLSDEDNVLEILAAAKNDGYQHAAIENLDAFRVEFHALDRDIDLNKPMTQDSGTLHKILRELMHILMKHYVGSVVKGGFGDIEGNNVIQVWCLVIDYKIAEEVIERELTGTKFCSYQRIYRDENLKIG